MPVNESKGGNSLTEMKKAPCSGERRSDGESYQGGKQQLTCVKEPKIDAGR